VRSINAPAVAGGPRLFIVHGHDEATKWEVKNFLQNRLHLPEPVVLHEQANRGRTIIEKFEEHAEGVDGAVVLLTPDDHWRSEGSDDELRRARQNVIFELGYFFGRFERRSGRVLLLYKGLLDLPSDIAGIIYIDISNGVEAAGEHIRRELQGTSHQIPMPASVKLAQ
jgi:predicted nucleotide-binding protein